MPRQVGRSRDSVGGFEIVGAEQGRSPGPWLLAGDLDEGACFTRLSLLILNHERVI